MARTLGEAILIVMDVGPSVGNQFSPNGCTFLNNAKHCATKIIQRNIFSNSKNEIGLILLGSEETNNPLADGFGYNNIEVAHSLQLAKWEMVHTIASFKTCTSVDGDWLDALIVAVDFMKTSTEGKKFKGKKIVMMTNFCSNVSDDEVNTVIQGIKSEEIEVVVIGPHVYLHSSQEVLSQDLTKSEDQVEGEKLIARIVNEVGNDSVICSFEDAIPQLIYFEQKKTRPTPWRTNMDIGPRIRIPIVGYKKIADVQKIPIQDVAIPSKQVAPTISNEESAAPLNKSQSLKLDDNDIHLDDHKVPNDDKLNYNEEEKIIRVDKDRLYHTVGDNPTPVDLVDIIEGYMFGTTVVAVTDDDKPALAYESGPKCLSMLGFTNKTNVPLYLLKGTGCYQIFPEKDENCMRAFSALVQAMDAKDVVGIARRVYNKNGSPFVGALFPHITPDFQCLVFIDLPYSEDVVPLVFPPLVCEKTKPTNEQMEVVDQLITSMDLMKADEDDNGHPAEAYQPQKVLDPLEQHFHDVVAKKALEGDLRISSTYISDTVSILLNPKKELRDAAKPALNRIKELFPLTEIKPQEGERKAAEDVFKQDKPANAIEENSSKPLPQSSTTMDSNLRIGTLRPQDDFKELINKGISLENACCLLEEVITDMILKAFDADDFNKPFKALICMREVCTEKNPTLFNEWLMKLKKDLPFEKVGFLRLIAKDKAGLITSSESNISTISEEEAKIFLDTEESKDDLQQPQSVDEDLDDLINQM